MSAWSKQQWVEQLAGRDETAQHTAAQALAQHGDASSVGPLVRATVRDAGVWHVTHRGIPVEEQAHPICQTASSALLALAPQHLQTAHADLDAWRSWKKASALDREDRPPLRNTPIGALCANLSNTDKGEFDSNESARAAWVLGEVGWMLRRWDYFLNLPIQWQWFVTLPPDRQGPTPRALIRWMAVAQMEGPKAAVLVRSLRELIGEELTDMLGGFRQRCLNREPSDLQTPMREIIAALGRIDHRSAGDAIVSVLREDWPDLHNVAVIALGQLQHAPAIPALMALLKGASPVLRARVAKSLGQIGDSSVVPTLRSMLNDGAPVVRTAAVRALGTLQDTDSQDLLFQHLLDPDETVRLSVGVALGMLGDTRTVPFMLRAIDEGDLGVQRSANAALRGMGVAALDGLMNVLDHGKPPFRAMAATRLGELNDPRAVDSLVIAMGHTDCHQQATKALQAIGEAAVPGLLHHLPSTDEAAEAPNETLQAHVVYVLGQINDPRAVPQLLALLSQPRTPLLVREASVQALGKLGDSTAVDAISAALRDKRHSSPRLRAESARALGRLKATSALTFLVDAMRESDDTIRNHAAQALGALGDPRAVSYLIKEINGIRRTGLVTIIASLGQLKHPDAIAPLMTLATQRPETHINGAAVRALTALGAVDVIPVILEQRSLHQELPSALRALGRNALPPLRQALRNGETADIRALAALSLGEMQARPALGDLIAALQDPSAVVQKAATTSLSQLQASMT